ncbi:MAG: type II toxin-antitoxin system RelE/ParE family toxin, partial [Proteobacteria bacterium]|nr:type II toxin-antitoxin system RelE/ParE family toxin [Pseudomonadota bacterium]
MTFRKLARGPHHISQDNPDSAAAFIQRLEEQIGTLEAFPERCSLVPENEFLGTAYRHRLFGNYRTIFKTITARVFSKTSPLTKMHVFKRYLS